MTDARAYAAKDASSPLAEMTIPRREPGPSDVEIDILYCGICHTDLHAVRDEWANTVFPIVPGHEIVGRVTRVGQAVTKFKPGELAAVGCMVDSDRACPACERGEEQFCPEMVLTFNSEDKHLGGMTYGGYSTLVVVDEAFTLTVPKNLELPGVAPLLCAGITTWSPLRRWGAGPGKTVGIVGLGGLGHMAVKFARAFGAHVVVFTRSPGKVEDALRLGAHEVVISTDQSAMEARAGSLDLIIDTVSAKHDINACMALLKADGRMVLVGAPAEPLELAAFSLIFGRKSLSGSLIGGIAETQEMLDFCGQHDITADVEIIKMDQVNEAFERLERSDVKYRFCLDMASLKG